jgi:hypothetical protein
MRGTVFRLAHALSGDWDEAVLHSFAGGDDDGYPSAGVTFDQAGNLYGTTNGAVPGGCRHFYGCGLVFQLSPGSGREWRVTARYSTFNSFETVGGLVLDAAGNIYATASETPYYSTGAVFEITP